MPAALERAGALEALYTDLCAGCGVAEFLPVFDALTGHRLERKLANRTPPLELLPKIQTFERWALDFALAQRIKNPASRVRALDRAHRRAGRAMARRGFGSATTLLVMFGEARGLLTKAQAEGLRTITDMNVAISTEAIVAEAQRRNPDWEPPRMYWGELLARTDAEFRPSYETLERTDLFMCPSEFVRDDLVKNFGIPAEKTKLVPYAVHARWLSLPTAPVPGKTLFVGSADLRKGIHVLAEAASMIRAKHNDYEFVVVGTVSDTVRNHPRANSLHFTGNLSRSELERHYQTADVFAFPSLAEGSAGATYEALGCGLPVVTTLEAGSIVRHGQDGLIVKADDPHALAAAIVAIVEDRARRTALSNAARAHASNNGWNAFQQRLLAAIFPSTRT